MDPVSLRGKRPREEPADTGASAAHGRSKAKRACPNRVTDAETWSTSGDEEYAKSEASEESECSSDEEDSESEASEESGGSGGEEDSQSDASVESECSTDEEDAPLRYLPAPHDVQDVWACRG